MGAARKQVEARTDSPLQSRVDRACGAKRAEIVKEQPSLNDHSPRNGKDSSDTLLIKVHLNGRAIILRDQAPFASG